MLVRLLALLLLPLLTLPAAKKNLVASARGENEDLVVFVTLHIDPEDVKEMIGNDLGGHYILAEVKVEPKFGKEIALDRDDFMLRTDKDGERAQPYSGSQIAGGGAMVVGHQEMSVGSPGWTGLNKPVVEKGGAISGTGDNALKKMLDSKILPEGKTDKPVNGLLYFPMQKQKMKDLEMYYGGRENRITMRFKP